MGDLHQSIFVFTLGPTADPVIIQIQAITAVTAWVDVNSDRVLLSLGVKLSDVLLQFPGRNYCSLSDKNGAVVYPRVVPRGVEVDLHSTVDGSS